MRKPRSNRLIAIAADDWVALATRAIQHVAGQPQGSLVAMACPGRQPRLQGVITISCHCEATRAVSIGRIS